MMFAGVTIGLRKEVALRPRGAPSRFGFGVGRHRGNEPAAENPSIPMRPAWTPHWPCARAPASPQIRRPSGPSHAHPAVITHHLLQQAVWLDGDRTSDE